jgi:acetyl-CoA carboxylase biotin carboxyl carrier protein
MAKYEARSEVTGSVRKVVCDVGQRLQPGDTVMIIESMKMEIPVIAENGGVVREILVAEGGSVEENQPVALLEAK